MNEIKRLRYYYHKILNIEERRLYDFLEKKIEDHKERIYISSFSVSIDVVMNIISAVYNDNPMFYYLNPHRIKYVANKAYVSEICLEYIYDKKQCEAYNKRILVEVKKLRDKCDGRTSFEKEQIIHDYLVRCITYDKRKDVSDDLERNRVYSIIGALIDKRAVCHGISCAFKLFCDFLGIKCLIVLGDAATDNTIGGHAWNIVLIEGFSYHVDVTWDLIKDKSMYGKYNYFNITDLDIKDDHFWKKGLYPPCKSIQHNFYFHKKLYVKNYEDFIKITGKFLEERKSFLPLRCIGFQPTFGELNASIEKALAKTNIKGLKYSIVLNQKEYVFIDFEYV